MNGILKQILDGRGYKSPAEVEDFLCPKYVTSSTTGVSSGADVSLGGTYLHNPYLLPDMQAAVERLARAINAKEKVVIYGDYDVDGMTATALLLDALSSFGLDTASNLQAYIPDRFEEGYGLNSEAIRALSTETFDGKFVTPGADLIITVDCGSLSVEEVALANELKMDVIITDHHNVGEVLPDAIAVVNPKRSDVSNPYPFPELCGCAVAFKLVQALRIHYDTVLNLASPVSSDGVALETSSPLSSCAVALETSSPLSSDAEKWLLDLVAFATVCDIMKLTDENRILVNYGLKVLKKTKRPGLRALIQISGKKLDEFTARDFGFGLGPRLNAVGRLGSAMTGVKLLSATSDSEATELAKFCNDENIKRRSIQDAVFSEAVANIERDGLDKDPVLIVSGEDWNEGVVGIVASKLMDKYKKPVFVLSEKLDKNGDDKGSARSNGDDKGSACSNAELICKGSARSFGDFPIGKAIAVTSQQGLILKGGGHNLAAGVTLLKSNLQNWKTAIFDYYNSLNLDINAQLGTLKPTAEISLDSLSELSVELYDELSSLEPYGSGNPEPIFEITNAIIADVRTMGVNKQHLKLTISDGNSSLDLLMWNYENDPVAAELVGGFDAQQGIRIPSILFTLQINEFRGNRTLQGMIKSISQK